jgi:hypothetical protein
MSINVVSAELEEDIKPPKSIREWIILMVEGPLATLLRMILPGGNNDDGDSHQS